MELTYDPAIPLLSIYPKKTKTLIQKYICTTAFIAALFTIAKVWKQPRFPYICIMEYYCAIKKNKILPFATTWMDQKDIILSKINQTKANIV